MEIVSSALVRLTPRGALLLGFQHRCTGTETNMGLDLFKATQQGCGESSTAWASSVARRSPSSLKKRVRLDDESAAGHHIRLIRSFADEFRPSDLIQSFADDFRDSGLQLGSRDSGVHIIYAAVVVH